MKTSINVESVWLNTPTNNYASVEEALLRIGAAREFQMHTWPDVNNPDAGGRSAEEWALLLQGYQNKLIAVYGECNGSTPEGRARFAKYAALQANLALWLVQATVGPVLQDEEIASRQFHDGIKG